jgi:hypothetical protein
MRNRTIIILWSALLWACGGGESSAPDAAAPDTQPFESDCGFPGDLGNELSIGKFCDDLADCADVGLPFCSSLGDPNTHFCTKTCTMGSTDECGTATECTCNANNQCGCTPTSCLN